MPRLETLRRIVVQRPQNPFPRYGLAMELRRTGANDEALVEFAELERAVPDYLPQYLMHGQLLVELARVPEAQAVLERGIALAAQKNDAHAGSELRSALEALALLK